MSCIKAITVLEVEQIKFSALSSRHSDTFCSSLFLFSKFELLLNASLAFFFKSSFFILGESTLAIGEF